jgi:hypothetical protein
MKSTSQKAPLPPKPFWEKINFSGAWTHWGVAGAFMAYILFLLWPALRQPNLILAGCDTLIFYPYKRFWIDSLRAGDPAYWNPYMSFGKCFVGDPQVGAFSPFNILHYFSSYTFAFTLEAVVHFFVAAFGTYLFLRSMGSRWQGAFLAGFVFAFGAFMMTQSYESQSILFWAISWMPFCLYFLNRMIQEPRFIWMIGLSVCFALSSFSSHPQMTYYTSLLCAFFALDACLRGLISFRRMFLWGLGAVGLTLLLISCQLLPAWEYLNKTNRWGWGISNVMTEYLSPLNLESFINPNFQGTPTDGTYHGVWGYHAVTNYNGLIPLGLFFIGLFYIRRVPRLLWFFIMAFLFTEMAMGVSTVPSKAIYMFFYNFVPGFAHHRTIGRMMAVTSFVMACAAGLVLNEWFKPPVSTGPAKNPRLPKLARWKAPLLYLLILISCFDLMKYDLPFVRLSSDDLYQNRDRIFPDAFIPLVLDDNNHYRIESTNRVTCSNMLFGLLQPVTDDYTTLNPEADYIAIWDHNKDTPLSDVAGIKYVSPPEPSPSGRWVIQDKANAYMVNTKVLPRAFVAGGYLLPKGGYPVEEKMIQDGSFDYRNLILLDEDPGLPALKTGLSAPASIVDYSSSHLLIKCHTDRPGLLFLSDAWNDGWKAWVNGAPSKIYVADGVFRSVLLPHAGDFEVRMAYRPRLLTVGLVLTAVGLGMVLILLSLEWRRRESKKTAPVPQPSLTGRKPQRPRRKKRKA